MNKKTEAKNCKRKYVKRGNPFKKECKNGNCWVIMFYEKKNGKNVPHYKQGFKTKAEAKAALDKINAKSNKNIAVRNQRISVREYFSNWYEQNYHKYLKFPVDKRRYSANTISQYGNDVNRNIIPYIGDMRLQEVTKSDLQDLYDQLMLERGLSANSIRLVHAVIKKAYNDAIDDELIDSNPANRVKLPIQQEYEPHFFHTEEIFRLVQVAQKSSIGLPLLMGLALGVRRGEALGTSIDDWDFKTNTVHLHQQITVVDPEAKGRQKYGIIPYLKGHKERTIGVPLFIMDLVRDRIHEIKKNMLKAPSYNDLNLLCCYDDGNFIEPKSFTRQYKRLLANNGFDAHRFHDLRGTQISFLHSSGIPLKTVSQNAGHASVEITDKKYCRILEVDHSCADKMQSAIFEQIS